MGSASQPRQRSKPAMRMAGEFSDWITREQHMTRGLSILRIAYGFALLSFLIPSYADRSYLWGEASFWVDPEAKRRGFLTFDLFFPKDNTFWFDIAFAAIIVLSVVFILGYRTRVVLPVLLVLLVSLQANNPYLLNGGDTLIRITMSFLLFANLSAHFSFDAVRLRNQVNAGRATRAWIPNHVSNAAHNLGLILCGFQIILVYVTSAVLKLSGSEWIDGTALYYALTLDAFRVYPLINELIWQSTPLVLVATWAALWVQLLFPVLLLWRQSRIVSVGLLALMHLAIAVFMGLWAFSLAMIALDLLFIRNRSWERLGEQIHALWRLCQPR